MLRRTFLLGCVAVPSFSAVGPTPAGMQSSAYCLSASPEGDVYLVWIETENESHALRVSSLEGDSWSPARTIAAGGGDWFVNWADHPTVSAGPGGRLMASWSYRPEAAKGSKWGLATRMVFSPDRGRSWERACDLGRDNVADYTGFIGFWAGEAGFRSAYLSPLAQGPHQHDEGHIKTLRFADFSLDGKLLADDLVDPDVCTCCPLATAETAQGPIVVYRDHEANEIRDISVVRRVHGKWTKPEPVYRDGWQINGCPTNGAVVQAEGERVAVAWFTAASGQPRVHAAFSEDAGAKFGRPLAIDEGSPTGWAGLALLGDGRTAVSWLERSADESSVGHVMVRVVDQDGGLRPAKAIAATSPGRSTGIPQMVRSGNRLILAWRQEEQVRTALLGIGDLP
ncbi:MAG: exo-alpha-sialidase [Acidobacteria bacterium]|nr:exo-alpha-sialidase [Acidobacteriota bacterium]